MRSLMLKTTYFQFGRQNIALAILVIGTLFFLNPVFANQKLQDQDEKVLEQKNDVITNDDAKSENKVEEVNDSSSESIALSLGDRIRAVSRKRFLSKGRFEIEPFLGASVNDTFFQHWMIGSRFAYHLTDGLSLDAGGALRLITLELPSVDFVKKYQQAIPDNAVIFGLMDMGMLFSPIYGKFSWLNNNIIHFDFFVSGGAAMILDSNNYNLLGGSLPDFIPGISPGVELGAGGRIFINKWLVLRSELRNYSYPQWRSGISTFQNILVFQTGISIFFPFDFEYQYVAAKVVER